MVKRKIIQGKKSSELKRNRVQGIPVIKHGVPQPGITKTEFMGVLAKAIPPVEYKDEANQDK